MADYNLAQGQSIPSDMHTKYVDEGDGTHALQVHAVTGGLTDAQLRATALDVDVETLPKPVGAPIVGQVAVGVTGTAIVIGTTLVLPGGTIIISAHSGNAAAGTVGGSGVTNTQDGSGNGYILEAGKSVVITAANLADVFVNGTAADIFSYAAG